jgi:ABC-type hemin transport system ATPase subunit
MLKDGKVLAQGSPDDVICSDTMGKLFNCRCRVGKGENGFWLRMETAV